MVCSWDLEFIGTFLFKLGMVFTFIWKQHSGFAFIYCHQYSFSLSRSIEDSIGSPLFVIVRWVSSMSITLFIVSIHTFLHSKWQDCGFRWYSSLTSREKKTVKYLKIWCANLCRHSNALAKIMSGDSSPFLICQKIVGPAINLNVWNNVKNGRASQKFILRRGT